MVNLEPGLLSLPRVTTITAALFSAIGSGTNYAYSAYAPQLGSRLGINHTKQNIIGLSGNIGVYLTAPIAGRIVDTRGPRSLFVISFFFLLIGYLGIRHVYDHGLSEGEDTLSTFSFAFLLLCEFMTGAGGHSSFAASVNATAKTFPDYARATATGIVISGFGLSAFFFSSLAGLLYPGDTSSFLLTFALGTAVPQVFAFFLVRPIPLSPYDDSDSVNEGSQISLLSSHHQEPTSPAADYLPEADTSIELNPSQSTSRHRPLLTTASRRSLSGTSKHDEGPNIYGMALFRTSDFWLTFAILTMLTGIGLMYINNVGSMAQSLLAHESPDPSSYDPSEGAAWQSKQVSYLSIMNFTGRILAGLISDGVKNKLGLPRSYVFTLVSSGFLCSQLVATTINSVEELWRSTVVLGASYGSVFVAFPNVCIEWFGISHFSENWGYLSMSPILGGNLFSLAFGRILDAHASSSTSGKRGGIGSDTLCVDGKECYLPAFRITIGASLLALALSVWAGWRDWKRKKKEEDRVSTVVWEGDDDEEV